MTPAFVQQQKLLLQTALEQLDTANQGTELRAACSVDSHKTGDLGDISSAIEAISSTLACASNSAAIKYEVVRALQKIDAGNYGICEYTGAEISAERLEAIPWARHTMEAQLAFEKNRIRYGDKPGTVEALFEAPEAEEPAEVEEPEKTDD